MGIVSWKFKNSFIPIQLSWGKEMCSFDFHFANEEGRELKKFLFF